MALPKIKKPEHGMLDGIKSKLGFADAGSGYDDGYYDQGYDDYGDGYEDDFGEYGPDYRDDGGASAAAPSSSYDPYAPVSTRPARTGRHRSTSQSGGITPPKLVSIDDVRAHTQVPESLNRDPLPPRRVTAASLGSLRGDRTVVEALSTAAPGTPNARAAAAQDRERSESLNALFSPTTSDATVSVATATAMPAAGRGASTPATATATAVSASAMTGSFDPYDAYAGTGAAKHGPTRSLTVIKPASYGEAERVAKALKAGDAVVIGLRNTPDNLAKRILDFSFGVSSALDASVDCVADKVFVITRGAALTEAERTALRNQGVL